MKTPVHTVTVGALLLTLPLSAAAQTPKQLFATVVTNAGSPVNEAIAAATALPDKMKGRAGQLAAQFQAAASQYRIEYLSESKDPVPVEVGVTRSGVRLTISDR